MADEVVSTDNISQVVKQAVQEAVQGTAQQVASQIAQQVGESVSQAIQKFMQTTGTSTAGQSVFGREEMGDIGGTERLEKDQMSDSGILFANIKRSYDEYQHESLESIKRNRSYVDKVISDAHSYDMQARAIATQALQNAVETANMVGKQSVRHGDVAIDRQWNVDEQGYTAENILRDSTFKEAIAGAVASAVADALNKAKV